VEKRDLNEKIKKGMPGAQRLAPATAIAGQL
jgi:hypothetical protein